VKIRASELATEVLLALGSGTLLVLSFPRFGWNWIAPIALVPLLLALHGETARRRFWLGHLAGCIYWGGTCYWIYGVMHEYGHVPAPGAAALLVGFFLVKGLHLGVFAWLAGPLLARWWAIPAVAALWTAIEGSHPYAAFTWLMLGHAAVDMSVVARLAPFTGVLGMSFALATMNVGVALAIRRRPRWHLAPLAALLLLYLAPRLPLSSPGKQTVWLVQPNIDAANVPASNPLTRWRAGATQTPDLILWPENPAPADFYNDARFRQAVEQVARTQGTYLIFSALAFRDQALREPLNSAVLLGPGGEEIARYDKIHLVPFGEFVPWPFGYLVEKVTREAGDFVPGDKVVVAPARGHGIGTFICYESVFGNGVRQFVAGGAEVLVNLSNDGWFGRTAARYQHLLIARSRAQENARWLLRATNTGLTRVIDPAGLVRAAIPPDQPGMLIAGFDYVTRRTLYTRWGDWFWWTTIAASLAALWQARKRKHAGRT
jgi:apolipoprotein N-acyltransferase